MTPSAIITFSYHALKLVSLSMRIELMLEEILEAELATEQRTK